MTWAFIFCGSSLYLTWSSFICGASSDMRFICRVDFSVSGHMAPRTSSVRRMTASPQLAPLKLIRRSSCTSSQSIGLLMNPNHP